MRINKLKESQNAKKIPDKQKLDFDKLIWDNSKEIDEKLKEVLKKIDYDGRKL